MSDTARRPKPAAADGGAPDLPGDLAGDGGAFPSRRTAVFLGWLAALLHVGPE